MALRFAPALLLLALAWLPSQRTARAQDAGWDFVGPHRQFSYSLNTFEDGLVVLATEGGLLTSADEGVMWQPVDAPGHVLDVAEGPGQVMLARTLENVLFSPDRGQTWRTVATAGNFVSGIGVGADTTLFFSSDTRTDCRVGTGCITYGGGLHASPDSGRTWRAVAFADTTVHLYRVTSDRRLYGTAGEYVIRSVDGGQTWERVPLAGRYAVNHAVVSAPGRVWLAEGTTLYVTDEGWRALMRVTEWDAPISRLYLDRKGGLYASVGGDVLYSADAGLHWTPLATPGGGCSAWCAITETRGGYLLIGTASGVYRSARPVTTATDLDDAEEPGRRLSLHVAPNPIQTTARIAFTLPAPGVVRVEVYDLLGRLQAAPTTGWMPAGAHEVPFDARGWAAGVYVCRITFGGFAESRLMIVVG